MLVIGSKELWVYVKPEIRKHQTDKGGVLILDDSIEEKPHTDENEIVAWHHSNAKGRHVKGINILSCLVSYGEVVLPFGYRIISKDLTLRKRIIFTQIYQFIHRGYISSN